VNTPRRSHLTPARRRLLLLMQEVNFGKIENLIVQHGEPVFVPAPRIIREIKLGGENGTRHESTIDDFALKAPVVELFDHLVQLDSGQIECLEIRHGLPQRLIIAQTGGIAA
jgi:hypothetical protein